jgi:uncharacterized protein YpbB
MAPANKISINGARALTPLTPLFSNSTQNLQDCEPPQQNQYFGAIAELHSQSFCELL